MEIWISPGLPIVYVNNAKSGCSTIKSSLKLAQHEIYRRQNTPHLFNPKPHECDDCLRQVRISMRQCKGKLLISAVRNPYSRALSGYLDKVEGKDKDEVHFHDFRGRNVPSFEDYLRILSNAPPTDINHHFRAQHLNLNYPAVNYDLVFYLEKIELFDTFLRRVTGGLGIAGTGRQTHSAARRLGEYYTPACIDLAQSIYQLDFELFGYTRDIARAHEAPFDAIAYNQAASDNVTFAQQVRLVPLSRAFQQTVRFRSLIDLRIV